MLIENCEMNNKFFTMNKFKCALFIKENFNTKGNESYVLNVLNLKSMFRGKIPSE